VTDPRLVLKRPLLTEKATIGRETRREYAFEVAREANKMQIKEAVETRFGVKVQDVRTVSVPGKRRRSGIHAGQRPDWKKALVTLREGQTIDLYEQM
jgi:large subunit ribosomal protein L23